MGSAHKIGQLQVYRAELHIHTVLSPCSGVEMIPPLIIQQANQRNVNIIAISDHNATANIEAVMNAAVGSGIIVLPGVELHTREEVHILCVFPDLETTNTFQQVLDHHLPPGKNRPEVWGEQFVVDSAGNFLRREERILNLASDLSISQAEEIVHKLDGLFIPAHIERRLFGVLPTLGFLPEDITFDALEIRSGTDIKTLEQDHPSICGYPILRNGDAHYLEDIQGLNRLLLEEPVLDEIRLALQNRAGRKVFFQEE